MSSFQGPLLSATPPACMAAVWGWRGGDCRQDTADNHLLLSSGTSAGPRPPPLPYTASTPHCRAHYTSIHISSHIYTSIHLYLVISTHPYTYLVLSTHPYTYLVLSTHPYTYLVISTHPHTYLVISTHPYTYI